MSTGFSVICLTVYQKFNRTTSVQASALAWLLSPRSTPFLEPRTQTYPLHAYKVQVQIVDGLKMGREALVFWVLGIEKKDLPNSKEKPLYYQAIPTAVYTLRQI